MFDQLYVGGAASKLDVPEQLAGYSRVTIKVSDEVSYTAGDDSGRELTVTCPWGTEAMAGELLQRVLGRAYQPYTADGAVIDPAFEIGDAVQLKGGFGGIYKAKTKMSTNMRANLSAPHTEEVNEAAPFQTSEQRSIKRSFQNVRASLQVTADKIAAEVAARENAVSEIVAQLLVQAGQIEAKVSREGGDGVSFGWKMLETSQTWYANGSEILRLDASGADLKGKITALAGKIGGFEIREDYLSYNGQTWGGTNSWGGYFGISGIQMGRNFKVDMAGNLEAASGRFTGEVYAGRINYGGDAGYLDGSGLADHSVSGTELGYRTVGTSNVTSGINTPLGYANYSNDVFNGVTMAPTAKVGSITFKDNKKYAPATLYYKAWDGSNKSVRIITAL